MLAAVKVKPKLDQTPFTNTTISPAGPIEKGLKVYDKDYIPTINNLESLRSGVINASNSKTNAPYNILLVGETGVGKSSLLELIANVLTGNDIDHYNFKILDHTNEQGGSDYHSQTNSARLYEFTSTNGIVVRILDTPGLLDTSRPEQAMLHRESMSAQIKNHLNSISAVLLLVNGTIARRTSGLHDAFSILSSIFPTILANNIAFVFTNIVTPLSWNFCLDTIPEVLKGAPQFQLDNPIALQRRYLKLKDNPDMEQKRVILRNAVKDGEQSALIMLVELFNWLGSLEPPASDGGCPLQNITVFTSDPSCFGGPSGVARDSFPTGNRA